MNKKYTSPKQNKQELAEQEYIARLVKILHSDDAIKLQNELSAFNPFAVLRIEEYEIRHTNTLAWLLDPRQSHGLGDAFLRAFIASLPDPDHSRELSQLFETSAYVPTVIREVDLERNQGRLDLLITDRETWAIAIEAKINSGEGEGQLERYARVLHGDEFKVWGGKRLAITKLYLTKEGDSPYEEKSNKESEGYADESKYWLGITWANNVCDPLSKTIKPFLSRSGTINPALQFIQQYLYTLNQIASEGDEVSFLVEKIAKEHGSDLREIEIKARSGARLRAVLNRHYDFVERVTAAVGSSVSRRAELLRPILETSGFYVPHSRDSYMPFVPNGWVQNPDLKDCLFGGLESDPLLIRFLVWNRRDVVGLKLEIRDLGDQAVDRMAMVRRSVANLVADSKNIKAFPGAFYKVRGSGDPQPCKQAARFFSIYSDRQNLQQSSEEERASELGEALRSLLKKLDSAGTVGELGEILKVGCERFKV